MNDLKRNKHFPEKIASNLKFLNYLKPEWSRYVTIVHQTKDLHTADYTQLYDFLKYNQKEVIQNVVQNLRVQKDGIQNQIGNGQNVGNLNGYNAVQNVGNQVDQNRRVQNIRNQNRLIGVQGNGNQNQIGNEQYTEPLEPIPESHQVSQNDNDVISKDTSVEQGGETVEQHSANF
nr:hypothetical protein [Tanacetum cinerariifolium]